MAGAPGGNSPGPRVGDIHEMAFLGCLLCKQWMDKENPCSGELEHKPSCWYEMYRLTAAAWDRNRNFLKWRYDNGAFDDDMPERIEQ